MRNLLYAIKSSNIIECVNARRETSVEAEDLVVNEGGEGKIVEKVCKVLPNIGIAILSKTFVVEAVNLGNLA